MLPQMKIIIIGNGIAGQNTADIIRKNNKEHEIIIYTKEKYPYYSRIFLPQYISNERTKEKLILRNEEWFIKNNVIINFNTEIIGFFHLISINKSTIPLSR